MRKRKSNGTRRSSRSELSYKELQATGCTPPARDVVLKQILQSRHGTYICVYIHLRAYVFDTDCQGIILCLLQNLKMC